MQFFIIIPPTPRDREQVMDGERRIRNTHEEPSQAQPRGKGHEHCMVSGGWWPSRSTASTFD